MFWEYNDKWRVDETFKWLLHLNDKGYELISQKLKYQLNNDY